MQAGPRILREARTALRGRCYTHGPMRKPELWVLPVSPWSERARWALEHHGIAYRAREHVPFLGELLLRRVVRGSGKKATVPVLVDGARVLTESWDIARYADEKGQGSPLVPAAQEAEVRRWNERADGISNSGRALVVSAMLASDAALDEGLPEAVPALLRAASRPVTRFATGWFGRKYGLESKDLARCEAEVREGLLGLREGLAGRPYLLDGFTYADVVMAGTLQGVEPVQSEHFPLRPATRAAWTRPALAREFRDLLAWRDALYAKHRAPR